MITQNERVVRWHGLKFLSSQEVKWSVVRWHDLKFSIESGG